MVTVVLDASSVLRYLDGEAGAERVAEVLRSRSAGEIRVVVSSVQWGEIACFAYKRRGSDSMQDSLAGLLALGIEVVPVGADRAVRSGIIKATTKIPYADAFCVELARDSPEHLLITADFDFKFAVKEAQIEFLPTISKRP